MLRKYLRCYVHFLPLPHVVHASLSTFAYPVSERVRWHELFSLREGNKTDIEQVHATSSRRQYCHKYRFTWCCRVLPGLARSAAFVCSFFMHVDLRFVFFLLLFCMIYLRFVFVLSLAIVFLCVLVRIGISTGYWCFEGCWCCCWCKGKLDWEIEIAFAAEGKCWKTRKRNWQKRKLFDSEWNVRVLFVLLILYIYTYTNVLYECVCASSIYTSVCVQLEMCFAACLADETDNHAGFPFKPSSLMSLPQSNAGKLFVWKEFPTFFVCVCVQVWLEPSSEIIRLPGEKEKTIRFFVLPALLCL